MHHWLPVSYTHLDVYKRQILARAGAKDGDLVLIVGDTKDEVVFAALGALRLECAKQLDILDPKEFRFLWVTEFPMFEWSEEEGRYQAMHHPFTAPMLEDKDKICLLYTSRCV